jgi:hypothetical protein
MPDESVPETPAKPLAPAAAAPPSPAAPPAAAPSVPAPPSVPNSASAPSAPAATAAAPSVPAPPSVPSSASAPSAPAATAAATAVAEPAEPEVPKVKPKKATQRACDEKDAKGKLCCGHLKRWYDYPKEIEALVGGKVEVYRCEFCKTLYTPDRSQPPHSYTVRY